MNVFPTDATTAISLILLAVLIAAVTFFPTRRKP